MFWSDCANVCVFTRVHKIKLHRMSSVVKMPAITKLTRHLGINASLITNHNKLVTLHYVYMKKALQIVSAPH